MVLPTVVKGQPHVAAHNAEREVINAIDARTSDAALGAKYFRSSAASIIEIGNSLASQGVLSYYDRLSSGTISFSQLSYIGWALPKTSGKFFCKGVGAFGGHTMQQIIDDFLDDAIAADPDYISLQVFTNNVGPILAATQTFEQAWSQYMQIVGAIIEAGITPIIYTVPPINTVTNSGAGLALLTKINLWLKFTAWVNGWPIVDFHAALVDPATNNFVAANTVDGVHLTAAGAKLVGAALANTLNAIPMNSRSPLWPSYNPSLMLPDVVQTSAAADKWYSTGITTGGWSFKTIQSPMWKGKSTIITRGSGGDYNLFGPIDSSLWIPGHKIRVATAFDASLVPTGGSWSVYLYNATQFQAVVGYTAMPLSLTNKSLTILTGTTTSGSAIISAAAGTFKPEHQGCGVSSVNPTGLVSAIPDNTIIRAVSADGTQAYLESAITGLPVNATATAAGVAHITISGPLPIAIFEFEVQLDMAGDSMLMVASVAGAAGVTVNAAQTTVMDLTALGLD